MAKPTPVASPRARAMQAAGDERAAGAAAVAEPTAGAAPVSIGVSAAASAQLAVHAETAVSSALAISTEAASTRVARGADLIGRTLGKYRIVEMVGEGGMGQVYEAINTTIQKRVALKVIDRALADDEETVARFQREALAASAVDSPYIVQIFDAGSDDEVPFIVMELLRGRDLGSLLKERKRLSADDAVVVARQVLKGLARAHDAGIVHRDLKPDNVFLVEHEGEPARVKLLDFGVSKIARSSGGVPLKTLTRQGMVVGTPYYMSPEQAQAMPDVDHRTDLYAVGAILYECLVGRPPHGGDSYEQVIVNICMHDADDVRRHNSEVPDRLAEVVRTALAREAEERFADARTMLAALAELGPATSQSGIELGARRLDTQPQAPAFADTVQASSVDSLPAAREQSSGVIPLVKRVDGQDAQDDGEQDTAAITQPGDAALSERAQRETAPPSLPEPAIGAPPQHSLAPWLAGAGAIVLLLAAGLYFANGSSSESTETTASQPSATAPLSSQHTGAQSSVTPPSSTAPIANSAKPAAARTGAAPALRPAHGQAAAGIRPRPVTPQTPRPPSAQPSAKPPPSPPPPRATTPAPEPGGLPLLQR